MEDKGQGRVFMKLLKFLCSRMCFRNLKAVPV